MIFNKVQLIYNWCIKLKSNKVLFILIIILMALSVSAVSASNVDGNATDIGITDDGNLADGLNGIYVDPNGKNSYDGSQDSPVMTIKHAMSIARDNDTIYLSDGEFRGDENTKLTVDKSLTFIGSDNTVINGQKSSYIFNIPDGVTVAFKNIKFINAYKSPASYSTSYNDTVCGACLDIKNATVKIDNCEFKDSVLFYGDINKPVYGGAISNFGDLTITNSNFTNNTALSTSGLFSYGGSLYNKGKASIINTSFADSTGSNYGNGIGIANDGEIIMQDSTLSNLNAVHESKGSAIYNTGKLMMINSIIENNYIERANFNYIYGAVYNSGKLTAQGCIFRNNTGYYEAPNREYKGSPNIYNVGDLNITYSAFIDNTNFEGISSDVFFNGGEIISLDNNWWNTNENPYKLKSKVNVDRINSWLIFNLTPDYSKLNISDELTVTALWTNNINLISKIGLFPVFNVTFKTSIDGREIIITKPLADGKCDFIFNYTQNKGSYELITNIYSFNQKAIVDVGKANSYVKFNVTESISYLDTLVLNVEVTDADNSHLDGTVSVKLADNTYNSTLANGKAKFEISDLMPKNYTLNIIYEGNDNYFKAFNSTSVNIKKEDVVLNISIAEIKVGQKGLAVVTLTPDNLQGQAVLYVDGESKKTIYIFDGSAEIALNNFAEGEYNITLEFAETEYYNSAKVSGILKVTRYDSSINISSSDINVGENATITVKVSPESIRGEATLIINGVNNTIFIDDAITNVTLTNLEAGKYDVTLIFDGDLRYYPVNTSTSFKVLKTPTSLDVKIAQDLKNLNGTVEVKTSNVNCTGVVGVYVNYNLYRLNLTDGRATFSVKFDNGTNYIFVFYEGDRYFEGSTWNTTIGEVDEFVLIGANSTGFEGIDFNYSVRLIEANGIAMPNRVITVDFNSKKHNITTNADGYAFFKVNLEEGTYRISATYKNTTIRNTLNVKPISFNLTSADITYGEEELIKAIFDKGVEGKVRFIIANESYVADIINGTAEYASYGFAAGDHIINAVYTNDIVNLTKTTRFNVAKAGLALDIDIVSATPEIDEIISVIDLANATGDIIFVFNNTEYKIPIINSQAVLNLSKLNQGSYALTVRYLGDNNYLASNRTVSFYVKQFASDIILSVDSQAYGKDIVATAKLNNDATGVVRFNAGNMTEDVNVSGGKAVWSFKGLDAGNYAMTATYLGNDYYVSSKNSTSFEIFKANSTIELYVKEVCLGENIRIFADLSPNATGSVTFSMIGYFSPRDKPVSNSASYWYIAPMDNGEYTVIAKYSGDNNYYPSNTTFILEVSQRKSILDVEINDAGINDRVMCKVSLKAKDGEPITSKVTLKIGRSTYNIAVRNGSGSLVLGKMSVGDYTYTADYAGDDDFTSASASGSFKVVNDLLKVNLTANNVTKYYKGSEPLKVTLKDSNNKPFANQNVVVKIVSREYTLVTDENGEAALPINLNPGVYDAEIVFEQTQKYYGASVNVTVEVFSTAEGTDVLKLYGSGTQYFAVFTDSNGKVLGNTEITFKLAGKSYKIKTLPNGVARLNININAGTYTISSVNPVTGQKLSNKITIYYKIRENKDVSNYFGAKTNYKVRIYTDGGKTVGAGKVVTFKVNGKTYNVKTDSNGYAKLAINLNPNKYTVTASYGGFKVSNKITVKNVLSASDITKKKSKTTKFSTKLVDPNGKVLSGKKITFKINGKTYSAKTNSKGIATVTIKITLNVGKHKIQSIYGKSKITNTITIKR